MPQIKHTAAFNVNLYCSSGILLKAQAFSSHGVHTISLFTKAVNTS